MQHRTKNKLVTILLYGSLLSLLMFLSDEKFEGQTSRTMFKLAISVFLACIAYFVIGRKDEE